MKKINTYLNTLKRGLWIRSLADAETLAEIEGHLIETVEQGLRQGLSAEEAEQSAIERFGSVRKVVGAFEKERLNMMQKILLSVAILSGLFLTYVDASPNWVDCARSRLVDSAALYFPQPGFQNANRFVVSFGRCLCRLGSAIGSPQDISFGITAEVFTRQHLQTCIYKIKVHESLLTLMDFYFMWIEIKKTDRFPVRQKSVARRSPRHRHTIFVAQA